ncbi:hypothetical protein CK489_16570 [Bradyrhizobium sp. UFLA03-84]|nr:hypothetical protein CK489_16570 [Bradyrhizobium sp. UFLA03-84]
MIPLDPFLHDLVDGLAALSLRRLVLAEGLVQSVATNGLEAVDLATGVLDGEGRWSGLQDVGDPRE